MSEAEGKVLWHVAMSLDGFAAGPDDAMDWALSGASQPSTIATEVIRTTGAILAGRRWHDVAVRKFDGDADIYGGPGPPANRAGRHRRNGSWSRPCCCTACERGRIIEGRSDP